jgi:hypothetical protein
MEQTYRVLRYILNLAYQRGVNYMTHPAMTLDHKSILSVEIGESRDKNIYTVMCENCWRIYKVKHCTALRIQNGTKKKCNKCSDRAYHPSVSRTYPEYVQAAADMAFVDKHWRIPRI